MAIDKLQFSEYEHDEVPPSIKTTNGPELGAFAGSHYLFRNSKMHCRRYRIVETLIAPLVVVEAEVRRQATRRRGCRCLRTWPCATERALHSS